MLKSLACKIAGHSVNRHRVWHDGINFRTACARCGGSLLRDQQLGWREFDPESDTEVIRAPFPGNQTPLHD